MTSKRKQSFDLQKGRLNRIKNMVDELEKEVGEPVEETTPISPDEPEAEVDREAKENLIP